MVSVNDANLNILRYKVRMYRDETLIKFLAGVNAGF